ncbi:DUF3888 domain-containing protein [Clostridium estertheticum]|uniref:DUF3888 domain-containing protein n=1 Tax=Clostridium estertheticum TaxID=238834 RepID=A0AA47EGG5_9CLOT|nr:DUF3888 domain-containing protein [Clostridium estertheticum]MBU3156360.1 DUF3888 domain-containing protein [Clostridium estertheticum]WAG59625.1 DUF3888 domain-containing protein [Clostridium estertheticum]
MVLNIEVDAWAIDILSVERPNGYRTFLFIIKMEVIPYVGPHLSVGVDRITITVDGIGEGLLELDTPLKNENCDYSNLVCLTDITVIINITKDMSAIMID